MALTRPRRLRAAALAVGALFLVSAAAVAQRGFGGFGREGGRLRIQPNARYDGRFEYEYETQKLPFDILCGTDTVRATIESGHPVKTLEERWEDDCALFARERKPFLLYN